jgi:hypothetical protein
MIFNSIYQPENVTGGVLGTSLIDLTSTSFAELFAQATNYGAGVTYKKGDLAYDQNSIWVYINNTSSSGNPPPTLPTISNAYWELVGTQTTQTFVWIAYANSADGATDFTTGTYDSGGITRAYIGIAVNKTSAVESNSYVDYVWSRFKGADGTSGVSPILVSLSRPIVNIMTDSNGNNGIYTNSGTNISVIEGLTTLEYDGVGTSSGTWKILSVVASGITAGTTAVDSSSYAIINDHSAISAATASITYNISGKNSSGVVFTTSVVQTFTRSIGAIVDTTPPGQVAGLTLTTSTETLAGGSIQVKLKATWTANTEADLSYYEPEIKLTAAGDATYIGYQTATNSYEWPVTAATSYTVRVRAADKSDNKGAYSTAVALTAGTDSSAPAAPTNLAVTPTFKNIYLSWTNPADTDISFIEVYRNAIDNSATATKVATVKAAPSAIGYYTDGNIIFSNSSLYYYYLKSVDTSGNISGFTTTSSSGITVNSVSSASLNGVTGCAQFVTDLNTAPRLGQTVTISGTNTGTGVITFLQNTPYLVAARGASAFILIDTTGVPLPVTTAGTIAGLTFTRYETATMLSRVGPSDIISGSITADKLRVGAITADIIAVPASGGLNASIQVGATGVSIGTVQTDAATGATNPTTRINAGATTIDPGKILISGATTLANWRNGSDATKIEGGSLATNTISANKLQIGIRGVDIAGIQFQATEATNTLNWTAGTITYTKDDGTILVVNITAGNVVWTTGTLYIYWVKNDTTPTTTLAASTATGTAYDASNIVLATYRGAVDFVANYGRTIIDGSQITTGTVNADRFKADSIIGNRLYVGGTNFRINGAEQGAGKGTLTVSDGSIDLIKLGYIDATTVGFQIKNTSGETVISSTTTAASINNSNISISGGAISGIGTGNNTVVANSSIAITSGAITGIGTGTGTVVANNSITIASGAINGIGAGTGTVVDNASIAVNGSGQLTGIGTGVNTVVANGQIAVNASGQLTGIGTGVNTVVANSQISISGGAISGIGTGNNTAVANSSIAISGGAITGIGTGNNTAVANASISIGANGSLSGAGGGQVTIGGLGYTGDLNATNGATIGTNLGGTFSEAEFNTRFTANTINGTFIKNATIDTAQIKDLAVSSAKIVDAAISNAKIGNLEVDSAKIANLTVGTGKITGQAVTTTTTVTTTSAISATANSTYYTIATMTFNKALGAESLLKFEFNLQWYSSDDIRGSLVLESAATGPTTTYTKFGANYGTAPLVYRTWTMYINGAGGTMYIPLSFVTTAENIGVGSDTYTLKFAKDSGASNVTVNAGSTLAIREEKK